MKRSLSVLIALLLLLSSTVGCNLTQEADFQKGLEAYEKKGYEAALRGWRPLAEQGHAKAQYELAGMYGKGEGVPKDYSMAVKWYTLAAEQGYAKAQHELGTMYYDGTGVPQNLVYAHMWFNIAASQGYEVYHSYPILWRDRVAKEMTPSQIEEAQELTAECEKKKYKGCDCFLVRKCSRNSSERKKDRI